MDQKIRQRGQELQELEESSLKALDALHVACAEAASANYFVTCDDRLIRRYRSLPQPKLKVCDPAEAVRILVGE